MTVSLLSQLSQIAGQAFSTVGLDTSYGMIVPSQRRELGQFQCNGALAAAKQAKRNPREIATEVLAELEKTGLFLELTLAGPGFINIRLNDDFLVGHINDLAKDSYFGCRTRHTSLKVILDYGGPNVAKARVCAAFANFWEMPRSAMFILATGVFPWACSSRKSNGDSLNFPISTLVSAAHIPKPRR